VNRAINLAKMNNSIDQILMNRNRRSQDVSNESILASLRLLPSSRPLSLYELSRRDLFMQDIAPLSNQLRLPSRQALVDNLISARMPQNLLNHSNLSTLNYSTDSANISGLSSEVTASSGHDFPSKLHEILSNGDFEHIVSWMPHGRSWKVHCRKEFVKKVAPQYFKHGKFESFTRQVNRWGFRRITHGIDRNAYYHEYFLRGLPNLCKIIKRPIPTRTFSASSDPDFYSDSLTNPPIPPEALCVEYCNPNSTLNSSHSSSSALLFSNISSARVSHDFGLSRGLSRDLGGYLSSAPLLNQQTRDILPFFNPTLSQTERNILPRDDMNYSVLLAQLQNRANLGAALGIAPRESSNEASSSLT